jgi:CheY-like chemotaxis protein
MTLTHPPAADHTTVPAQSRAPRWHNDLDLAALQLDAIERFNASRRLAQEASAVAGRSREMRMDANRALEVMRRQHDALVARTHEQLRLTGDVLHDTRTHRVVVAHRNEWFVGKLVGSLQEAGLSVVACVDNGADAIGLAVAEQPDLVLVEDALPMVPGEEVVREVRRYAPSAAITVQVAYDDRVGLFLDAGATSVLTRRVPPAEVAKAMLSQTG